MKHAAYPIHLSILVKVEQELSSCPGRKINNVGMRALYMKLASIQKHRPSVFR